MVQRYRESADRILLTKPGYDATNPGLADNQKLFDSNWNFSGAVIAAGTVPLSAWPSSGVLVIPFASPGYVPAAVVTFTTDISGTISFPNIGFPGFYMESSHGFSGASKVYADRIEVVQDPGSSGYFRFPMTVRYTVFGL